MEILANHLRKPVCGGLIAPGDFDAINPEDHTLLDNNRLLDT